MNNLQSEWNEAVPVTDDDWNEATPISDDEWNAAQPVEASAATPAAEKKGWAGRTGDHFAESWREATTPIRKTGMTGTVTQIGHKAAAIAAPLGGAVIDTAVSGISAMTSDMTKQTLKEIGGYLGDTDIVKAQMRTLRDFSNVLGKVVNVMDEAAPGTSKFLMDLGEASTLYPAAQVVRAVAPIAGKVAVKGAKAAANTTGKIAKETVGAYTGGGPGFVEEMAKGSKAAERAMRGQITGEEIVEHAKHALQKIRDIRGAEYRAKLEQVRSTPGSLRQLRQDTGHHLKKLIDPDNFDLGIKRNMKTGKIEVDFSRSTIVDHQPAVKRAIEDILSWTDDSARGLDNLKKRLGDYIDQAGRDTPAKSFITQLEKDLSSGLKKSIPEYEAMTKGYAEASTLIKDIESNLMLRKEGMTGRITADNTLRRLTSALRENFEMRKDLLRALGTASGEDVAAEVAGYVGSQWIPRGAMGKVLGAGSAYGLHMLNPKLWPIMAASSPRVVGEFLNAFGKARNTLRGKYGKKAPRPDPLANDPSGIRPTPMPLPPPERGLVVHPDIIDAEFTSRTVPPPPPPKQLPPPAGRLLPEPDPMDAEFTSTYRPKEAPPAGTPRLTTEGPQRMITDEGGGSIMPPQHDPGAGQGFTYREANKVMKGQVPSAAPAGPEPKVFRKGSAPGQTKQGRRWSETPEPDAPRSDTTYKAMADDLGLTFNGQQSYGKNSTKKPIPLFTDPVTKSTIGIEPGETLFENLAKVRKQFGAEPPEIIKRAKKGRETNAEGTLRTQYITDYVNRESAKMRMYGQAADTAELTAQAEREYARIKKGRPGQKPKKADNSGYRPYKDESYSAMINSAKHGDPQAKRELEFRRRDSAYIDVVDSDIEGQVYAAIRRDGGMDWNKLRKSYDADTLKELSQLYPGILSKKGARGSLSSGDEFAQEFGYADQDEMINRLLSRKGKGAQLDDFAKQEEAWIERELDKYYRSRGLDPDAPDFNPDADFGDPGDFRGGIVKAAGAKRDLTPAQAEAVALEVESFFDDVVAGKKGTADLNDTTPFDDFFDDLTDLGDDVGRTIENKRAKYELSNTGRTDRSPQAKVEEGAGDIYNAGGTSSASRARAAEASPEKYNLYRNVGKGTTPHTYPPDPPDQFKTVTDEIFGEVPPKTAPPSNHAAIIAKIDDKPWEWTADDLMDLRPSARDAKLEKLWGKAEEYDEWFEGGDVPTKRRYWPLYDHAAELEIALKEGDAAAVKTILKDIQKRLDPQDYGIYEQAMKASGGSLPVPAKSGGPAQQSIPGLTNANMLHLTPTENKGNWGKHRPYEKPLFAPDQGKLFEKPNIDNMFNRVIAKGLRENKQILKKDK